MKLIYSQNNGQISNASGAWQITAAPDLGFAYDGIFYDSENGHALKYVGEGRDQLSEHETTLIWGFLITAIMPAPVVLTPDQITLINRAALQPLSAWQIRKVLIQFNLRDQVETAIAKASMAIQDAWHYAGQFKRDDDVLLAAAASLGITDAQLDTMFEVGATL